MHITYSDTVRPSDKAFGRLQEATAYLEETRGPTATVAVGEWDRTEDVNGQPRYELRLSAGPDAASRQFTLEELQSSRIHFLLSRLWDTLLQVKNERQMRELLELSSQED
jgi:hypothetical protein